MRLIFAVIRADARYRWACAFDLSPQTRDAAARAFLVVAEQYSAARAPYLPVLRLWSWTFHGLLFPVRFLKGT